MGKLIKAEFLKLSKLRSYKILLLFVIGMGLLMGYSLVNTPPPVLPVGFNVQNGFYIYMSILSEADTLMFFSLVFVALFVCTEFSNRTFSISLFSGCPRWSVLLAKIIVFLAGLMPIVFAAPIMASFAGSISLGLGNADAQMVGTLIQTTLLSTLSGAAMGGFCFMMAVLIKNIAGTIGAGIGIVVGMEMPQMVFGTAYPVKWTFVYQMEELLQLESIGMFLVVTVTTLMVTLGISIIAFQKAELK